MPIPNLQKTKQSSWKDQVISSSSPKNKKKVKPSLKKKLFLIGLSLFFISVLVGFIFIIWLSKDLPSPNELINREVAQSTKIYDRTGENILYEIHGDQKRTIVSLSDLPDYVKQAPISIEDKNFYTHGGFSIWAMFRTVVTNVIYNRRAGGSTLTQQFIKNAILTSEKKITRKLKEIVLAYRLEQKFSKDEILQMYLNEIPYGSNTYGIEAASLKYFNKSAKDISLAEAALLAAITQAPSRYSPYGPNKDLLLGRKDYVLTLMQEQGYISEEEKVSAQAEEIVFANQETNITAPHFVMYIKELLAEKYGEKIIEQDGLKIYTTLDLYKQKIAEEVIKEKTENYQEKYNASNAALVSIDPKTGQILAMVGSRDYFDEEIDGQVNVSLRPRQPGSSIKPIVYASLFTKGYTPNTILYDVITNFSNNPSEPYIPQNYSGNELGPVSVRKALAGSLNIPAVKALYLAGINNVINLAEKMGYTTLYPRDRFGLALVLGGAEVYLLEHVNAYSAFARDGKISPIVGILRIEDKDGKILEEYKPVETQVFDSKVARMINSVLSDNSARSYVFGEKNSLTLKDRPVAAKTGTTNDYRDAWTVGYTPSIVTGVWIGNSNNEKMKGVADGSVLAAPIWNSYMAKVLGDTPVENFKEPEQLETGKDIIDGKIMSQTLKIDKTTGGLANSFTPIEFISEITVEDHHSILYFVNKEDPLSEKPSTPTDDPQFSAWEKAVLIWAEKNASSSLLLLKDFNETHNPENVPFIEITQPLDGDQIENNFLEININAQAKRGINKINYFIDNNLWHSSNTNDSYLKKDLPLLNNGYHSLLVSVCDDVENCSEDLINFNLKNQNLNNQESSSFITNLKDNLVINKKDFPVSISVSVQDHKQASRLLILAKSTDTSETTLIARVDEVLGDRFEVYWQDVPPVGSYYLYTETKNWSGINKTSPEILITITD